jgi:tripartite-type tricarboxylate transporter receptor subunit TctC
MQAERRMTTRRNFTKGLLAMGLMGAQPRRVLANDWPKRPVRLIVPFAAGGNTDGIARLVGQYLGDKLGGSFVVENRVGAGGAIAMDAVARSAPDGYTLVLAALPQIAILPSMEKTNYDPARDFAPICNIASNPFCLVANPQFEPKTLQDFVAYVKARPGQLAYASGGTGSLAHLTMVLFLQRAGLEMLHVPYKGGAPAITDVIGNQVPLYFANLSEALPHAGGALRALAVSGTKRVAKLPDVPTVAESGYPGFRSETWNGLLAPAHTPQAIVDLLATEAQNAVKDPVILQRFDGYGVEPIGANPKEFGDTIAADVVQWRAAVKAAGLSP